LVKEVSSPAGLMGKHILLIGINYWPEETGNAPYTTRLAEHLVSCGASVTAITGMPLMSTLDGPIVLVELPRLLTAPLDETLALAPRVRRVVAVEPSAAMAAFIPLGAAERGITNVTVLESTWEDATVEPADDSPAG